MTARVEHIGLVDRVTAIYALCEYPGWRPRYVGKTVQYLNERHKAHIRDARRGGRRPVSRWLRKCISNDAPLAIKLIEYVAPGEDWASRERYWIATYRAENADLLNICDGGEGFAGYRMSDTHKANIAAALRTGGHFNCIVCGAQFWRKKFAIKNGDCRFCSRACCAASLKGVSRAIPAEVIQLGVAAAAFARRARTHCKRGHDLTGDNMFRTSSGGRGCRQCQKIHKQTYREKSRG